MATVLLIRHGQASYGEADYDRLSSTGKDQAAALGRHLSALQVDAMFVGPLMRQQQTAALAAEHAPGLPTPATLPELAEYPGFELVRLSGLGFKDALGKWSRDEWELDGVERVHEFAARVRSGIENICAAATSGARIAVVTSAGPIGVAVGSVFGSSAERMIRTSVVVRNASITELVFRSKGFAWHPDSVSLLTFNTIAHLPPELHTEY